MDPFPWDQFCRNRVLQHGSPARTLHCTFLHGISAWSAQGPPQAACGSLLHSGLAQTAEGPHHGLHQGLQSTLCSSTCSTSSTLMSAELFFSFFSFLSKFQLLLRIFLLFLKYLITEVLPTLLMSLALASSRSILEPADIGEALVSFHRSHFSGPLLLKPSCTNSRKRQPLQ